MDTVVYNPELWIDLVKAVGTVIIGIIVAFKAKAIVETTGSVASRAFDLFEKLVTRWKK